MRCHSKSDTNSPDVRYSLGVLRVRCPDGDFVSFGTNVNDGTADVSTVWTETLTDETQQLQGQHFQQNVTIRELKLETNWFSANLSLQLLD